MLIACHMHGNRKILSCHTIWCTLRTMHREQMKGLSHLLYQLKGTSRLLTGAIVTPDIRGEAIQVVMSVKGCLWCKQFEAKLAVTNLVTIESTKPLDLLHIDIVNMETTIATKKKPVVKKVLVAVDHFTRYVRAFVIPDHRAKTIAQTLYDNYFSVFGFPCRLMSDQAPEFVGGI